MLPEGNDENIDFLPEFFVCEFDIKAHIFLTILPSSKYKKASRVSGTLNAILNSSIKLFHLDD